MGLNVSHKAPLLGPWDSARTFLVALLDEWSAALASLSPLTEHLTLPYTTSGTLLTDSHGLPRLHQQARACVASIAGQSIPNGAVTTLTFVSADFDVGGLWNPAFPSRMTVPLADGEGAYLVIAVAPFAANAVGQRQLRITKNGTSQQTLVNLPAAAAGVTTLVSTMLIPAIGGDYFGMDVFQDSGGALAMGTQRVQLTAMKLAAA